MQISTPYIVDTGDVIKKSPPGNFNEATIKGARFNLKAKMIRVFVVIASLILLQGMAEAQITYTISKTNNAPNPIPSGQPFTYTITYSWSGGAPGTLYIVDNIPASLQVISALPASPVSQIIGNQVTFTISGLTLPSGSGTVQINAKFKPGVTCGGTRACNVAGISVNPNSDEFVYSNESCVTAAEPQNKWQFEKEWIAGCAVDDEVIFRIKVVNPAGSDIGGLNLTNLSLDDFIPSGAIITGITGFASGISGTSFTGMPPAFTVSPWTAWYVLYVKVNFPSPTFTSGQTVIDTAQLKFNTPCDTTIQTWTDTASVTLCQGVTSGSLGKYLTLGLYFPNNPSWYPVFTPGCCGTYRVYYHNTGTLGQTNFIMEDDIPGELDVNSIKTNVPAGNTPVTVEVYCWSGGTCGTVPCTTVVHNTPGIQTITGLPPNVCKVKWTYSGTIAVSQYLYNYLDVCVRSTNYQNGAPVVTGQNIINTATVSATGLSPITTTHTKPVDATQPKVVATKLFIGDCNNACQVQPGGPYQPGDTVRFRMAVANIGNADATTCSITDNLPSGLSYVGNETYFYGTFNWMTNIYNPPCCSLTTTVPPDIGSTINTPSAGDTNLTWSFPLLPGRCDGQVDYFIIDFDVVISEDPPAPAGQYPNTFTFSAGNVPNVNSNVAYLTVNATAQLQALKEVRKQFPDGTAGPWSNSASVLPGGIAEYKLTVINTGNTPLSDLCLLDIMPWIGDIKVLPAYTSRGSMFDMPYNPADGAITITPAGFSPTYNSVPLIPSKNPKRSTECGGFCGVSDPAGSVPGNFVSTPTQSYSFKVNANASVNLAPGATLETIVPAKVPQQGVNPQDHACNSFAIQAVPVGLANVCLSAESNTACVQVAEKEPCFRLFEQRMNCIGMNQEGNWVYQLQFSLTNLTGQSGSLIIVPDTGSVQNINPGVIPAGTPTNVSAVYISPTSGGTVCFTVVLMNDKDQKLCDTTFCLDFKPCPEPCPCPFDIRVDKPSASQSSGNLVWIDGLLSTSTNIQKVTATVVSASITQSCLFGGTTTYTPPVTITWASWNPLTAIGLGTSEVTWTNLLCPPMNNKQLSMYLDIPSAPSWKCWQKVKVCIRYTFTDCKCNTCDTVVCYEFRRKWTPIIIHDGGIGHIFKPGIADTKDGDNNNKVQAETPEDFVTAVMTSENKGTITINNPKDDEYTMGVTLLSVRLTTSPGIRAVSLQPDNKSWSSGMPGEDGITSTGILKPGESLTFEVEYDNSQTFRKWVNTLDFDFTVQDIPDTLFGAADVTVRIPGAAGGDILVNMNPGNKVENARTFALQFVNANLTQDSIAKLTLKVKDGSILAVGPGLNSQEMSLGGYAAGGYYTLLPAAPDENMAMLSGLPSGANIGPIYITVATEDPGSVMLEYQTQTGDGDIITNGSLELTNPVLGVKGGDDGSNINTITLSEAQPNPTDGATLIRFGLSDDEPSVTLYVSDALGNRVATLINGKAMYSGEHDATFNPGSLPNGVYFYTITTGNATQTRKLLIIR